MDLPWDFRPARSDSAPAHDLRASDADRERVVEVLRDAMADGRLADDEFSDRMERAYAARTLGELAGLTEDLLPADKQPFKIDNRPINALFRQELRDGRWVVPPELTVTSVLGSSKLDLREAILQSRHTVINLTAMLGGLELQVPAGVEVVRIMRDGRRVRLTRGEPPADAPVIEVRGLIMGEVKVKAPKPPRKGWRRRLSGH